MENKEKLIVKKFNFAVNDRVRISKNAPMYGKNSFHPKDVEGTLVNIKLNSDKEGTNCPLYIVWDNNQLSANCLQDVELVEAEALEGRYEYEKDELFFENFIPSTPDEVLPALYSEQYKTATATYYKNKFGILLHCVKGKLRSFADIYYLFKAYFPEETMESVFKRMLLYSVKESDIDSRHIGVQLSECSTMKRIRYIPHGNNYNTRDIWRAAMDARQYESIIHWRDLFGSLGIRSETHLQNWYKSELKKPILLPLIPKA